MERWTGSTWWRLALPVRVGVSVIGFYTLAMLLVIASWVWGWRGGPYVTRPVDEAVKVLCLVFAAACAYKAARAALGRRRLGWAALVVALLGWAIGEAIWAVYDVRPESEHAAHPATADVVLFLYPVGVIASLLLLSKDKRSIPWRVVLDGVIIATSLFAVSWTFVLEKQLLGGSNSRAATLTHVCSDVTIITMALLVLSRGRPGGRPSLNLLAGGVAMIGVADIVMLFLTGIGTNHPGDLADLVRVGALDAVALAALSSVYETPTASRREQTTSNARLWLPYLPLALAAAVGLRSISETEQMPMLAAMGILVCVVLVRQLVVLVENQGLLTKVAREAFRDSLTGLANRAHFLNRVEHAVARRKADAAPIAVLCLDLDNFKSVNDALGHPAGDELLIRVAGRLTDAVGETGIVARLGGDEFAFLMEGSIEESQAAAHRVLEAFRAPIVIDGVPLEVRPSIGFTVATAASNCGVDELLRHADLAMYAAKREGGQCIRSFVPELPGTVALPDSPVSASAGGSGRNVAAPTLPPIAEVATATQDETTDVPSGIKWPPLAVRIALGTLVIGVIGYFALSAIKSASGHSAPFAQSLYTALNLTAAALIAVRAYRVAADRLAWSLIAAGMACSAAGDVVYALWVPDGQSPSAADPAYLAFYPLVYAGVLVLMRARLRRLPIPIRIDFLVCTLTVAALATALAAGPVHAASTRAPATVLVGLIYPAGDLLLLALAAGMMPIRNWRNEYRLVLLAAGFALFAIADTAYLFQIAAGSYRVGSLLDACWPASSLLVATASWAPSSSAAPEPKRGLSPYFKPVACAGVAVAVAILAHQSRVAVTLAALALIATTARFSVTFRDISMLAEKHRQAMTDNLTALPNRRSLATALTESSQGVGPLWEGVAIRVPVRRALLLVDLYEFQEISESIGQHYGDELLCHIVSRLSNNVRSEDLLARAGDNEFAVLLAEGSDLIAARALAGRLLDALSAPFAMDPITVQIDARIAIALYPDHCDHPQELLTRVETAIPHAKTDNSGIAVYDAAFELYRDNDPNLMEELRAALLDGEQLTCHYQPKINARDGSIHSLEALLRWQHPSRGPLLPEEFLPAAERAGLMRKVANHTVDVALGQLRSWREQGVPLIVAVNLSTTNLLDLDLVGTIERLLRTHGLPAEALIIEITESTLVDSVRARNTVAALRGLGVRISLDDYGTGWSSLARLQDVSVDELKLDRIFVARLSHDPRSVAIVRSTVALAHSLGADLVAEGVEDEVTLNAVRRYGCTITQGFVHSPPLPADDMLRWIVSHVPERSPGQSQQAGVSD